ncbi:MAG: amylo-alpha-1,6-glucosidase, partial [Leptolyngbyaceae cyanobacterium bins.59]|nr:amylo-alpha-1,6-glucosidase [Leptolyngbyaceae cyanobacterium bins.59]
MEKPDTREWLLTNGLGSFASGTLCDARTRTYHGWLLAALDPPGQRTLLFSHLEASLEIGGEILGLGTNFWTKGTVSPTGYQWLQSFTLDPIPTWTWRQESWQLTREFIMPYGLEQNGEPLNLDRWLAAGRPREIEMSHRILIRYQYRGQRSALLRLRLLIGDRNFHNQQRAEPEMRFSQLVAPRQLILQAIQSDYIGTPWHLRWTQGHYHPDAIWYWHYHYPEETQRGLTDCEDLYSPGYLTIPLESDTGVTLEARVGLPESGHRPLDAFSFDRTVQAEQQRLHQCFQQLEQSGTENAAMVPEKALASLLKANPSLKQQLLKASDQFIVYRVSSSSPTVMAGYPWFSDWGRNALIALPGLALSTQRFALAKGILETWGHYCQQGLIPNTFPETGSQPIYNSIDAALWWIESLGLYLEATQDWAFLMQQYGLVQKIYKAFTVGTLYNIRVDASDGLLTWDAPDAALTWMDTFIMGQPLIPRRGKPVEVNALWYSTLCWAGKWAEALSGFLSQEVENQPDLELSPGTIANQARRYLQHAQQVRESLQQFWNSDQNYLYDTLTPNDQRDASIRPNAVLALSFYHCGFPQEQGREILKIASDRLLTPYGLRSLDPNNPAYVGSYSGNVNQRDRAYYQGTTWSWLMGPFIRAWKRFNGDEVPVPFDWEPLFKHFEAQACLGSISEVFDGDPPYSPQGAVA